MCGYKAGVLRVGGGGKILSSCRANNKLSNCNAVYVFDKEFFWRRQAQYIKHAVKDSKTNENETFYFSYYTIELFAGG